MESACCCAQSPEQACRDRSARVLARARRKQLELAREGKVLASGVYARRANRVRRESGSTRQAE